MYFAGKLAYLIVFASVQLAVSLYCVHKVSSMSFVTLTFEINRGHPLPIVNLSAKLDEEAHNGLVSIKFTRAKRAHKWNHNSVTISPPQHIARG